MGLEQAAVADVFGDMDRNGDGVLTLSEFQESMLNAAGIGGSGGVVSGSGSSGSGGFGCSGSFGVGGGDSPPRWTPSMTPLSPMDRPRASPTARSLSPRAQKAYIRAAASENAELASRRASEKAALKYIELRQAFSPPGQALRTVASAAEAGPSASGPSASGASPLVIASALSTASLGSLCSVAPSTSTGGSAGGSASTPAIPVVPSCSSPSPAAAAAAVGSRSGLAGKTADSKRAASLKLSRLHSLGGGSGGGGSGGGLESSAASHRGGAAKRSPRSAAAGDAPQSHRLVGKANSSGASGGTSKSKSRN